LLQQRLYVVGPRVVALHISGNSLVVTLLGVRIWSMSKRKPWLFQHFADFFNPERYFFESL